MDASAFDGVEGSLPVLTSANTAKDSAAVKNLFFARSLRTTSILLSRQLDSENQQDRCPRCHAQSELFRYLTVLICRTSENVFSSFAVKPFRTLQGESAITESSNFDSFFFTMSSKCIAELAARPSGPSKLARFC
eukprot:693051-Prorocentrum_minimum.AAC.2